jgi:glycosyltransferase involved in cell wall biosynthesis
VVSCFSTRFIVMDNAIAETFLKPGGGLPGKIAKLYDGVDLELFRPRASVSRIRRELGLDEQTPLVGMVARLDPAKGPDLFLEIAARVHAKLPQCRFLLCGGEIPGHEGYEAVLHRKANELGLERALFLTGWRYRYRDIPEVYNALTVSLQCPVYPEPYGLAHVEAMASGVPIVAFAQGGPAELCVNGQTAFLVPPGDVTAAAEAVENLLRDPERIQRMGAAGRKRAELYFDRRRCVRELELLYESILGEKH